MRENIVKKNWVVFIGIIKCLGGFYDVDGVVKECIEWGGICWGSVISGCGDGGDFDWDNFWEWIGFEIMWLWLLSWMDRKYYVNNVCIDDLDGYGKIKRIDKKRRLLEGWRWWFFD